MQNRRPRLPRPNLDNKAVVAFVALLLSLVLARLNLLGLGPVLLITLFVVVLTAGR